MMERPALIAPEIWDEFIARKKANAEPVRAERDEAPRPLRRELSPAEGEHVAPIAVRDAQAANDWPEPKPLPDGLLPVAPFDLAFLPASVAPWVADRAREYRERKASPLPGLIRVDQPDEPPGAYVAPSATVPLAQPKFRLEPFAAIRFETREEWLVRRLLPREGIAAVYGRPGSLKSFLVSHLALCVALGWHWAGRRVTQAPAVYVAAEGAAGLRKRKCGFERAHANLPEHVPFYLISASPNLGTERSDLETLISSIESAGVAPGLIVVDTLAATLGAGDENGSGMIQLVANASALAARFKALVLIVHHNGLGDERRLRGHSSLAGALDSQILCERNEGDLAATLTLQKIKDEVSDVRLTARLSRIVIGQDEDGDEISTLVVDSIEDAAPGASAKRPKAVPSSQRFLMAVVAEAIEEAGENVRPFGANGPPVRGVADGIIRSRYYARIAEQAAPDEDRTKLAERQRKAFNRAIADAIKATNLVADERNGERFIWLP